MTGQAGNRIAIVGGMTIDDVVLYDGSVHRRMAGGNALYCALGARVWGARSEIVSFVGHDYPAEVLAVLDDVGIGTTHIHVHESGSIRLWILYEEDGRRQIHLQHGSATLGPLGDLAPRALRSLLALGPPAGAHVAALPVHVQRQVADVLVDAGIPFTLDCLEAKGSVGGDLLDYTGSDLAPQAFLPSREEFALLFGDVGSADFGSWTARTSTSILVIKDGEHGSLVFSPLRAAPVRVPVLDVPVLDPTGAGDAYCGGFAAGMFQGRSAIDCALMGTVSASFAVEQVGTRGLFEVAPDDAHQRREVLRLALSHEGS